MIVFLMIAFRLAWPAFAYSIDDDNVGEADVLVRAHVPAFVCCWISLALGVFAPWIVKILAPSNPQFHRADEAIGLLAFALDRVRGLHRARDRDRPRAADAVQLDRQRASRRR